MLSLPASSTFLAAFGLALIHLYGGRIRRLQVLPRSRLLSMASGASVAYVFVRILPSIDQAEEMLEQAGNPPFRSLSNPAYVVALAGLTLFYGLELIAQHSRREQNISTGDDAPSPRVFWLHISSFTVVNVLIGYLLYPWEERGGLRIAFFFVAMALYFLVNDHGLRQLHRAAYRRIGRWLLAGAVLLGWFIHHFTELSELVFAIIFAFIGGVVVFNVLKEELPPDRQSRFSAFALGAGVYAALLLAS